MRASMSTRRASGCACPPQRRNLSRSGELPQTVENPKRKRGSPDPNDRDVAPSGYRTVGARWRALARLHAGRSTRRRADTAPPSGVRLEAIAEGHAQFDGLEHSRRHPRRPSRRRRARRQEAAVGGQAGGGRVVVVAADTRSAVISTSCWRKATWTRSATVGPILAQIAGVSWTAGQRLFSSFSSFRPFSLSLSRFPFP
jgi:hypothetical protein